MNEKLPEDLKQCAATFAEEIRKGEWDGNWDKSLPVPTNQQLIEELKARITGFTQSQYEDALAFGMYATR